MNNGEMHKLIWSEKKMKEKLNLAELTNFSGSENYYKDFLGVLLTDGAKHVSLFAAWLITDIISVVKTEPKTKKESFVSIEVIKAGKTAKVIYSDGNGNITHTQLYGFAELPQGKFGFYFTDNVLMLKGEY